MNKGGAAEAEWAYHYKRDPDNPSTEKPQFFFNAAAQRCKLVKSGGIEISAALRVFVYGFVKDGVEIPAGEIEYSIKNSQGQEKSGKADSEGYIEEKNVVPDDYTIQLGGREKMWKVSLTQETKIILQGDEGSPSL